MEARLTGAARPLLVVLVVAASALLAGPSDGEAGTELLGYEERILDGLFASGAEVRVSELTGGSASPYQLAEVDRWSKAFADLGVELSSSVGGWYVGHGMFHPAGFSSGLSDFSTAASTALTTVPSTGGAGGSAFGGGGSSGGGFGGGGGSW